MADEKTYRKGIVLAGGAGARLHPATAVISKQMLPVYDKPMIYYPLSTLMLAGIRDILVISTPQDTPCFENLLGDGSNWGLNISYAVQHLPGGLAQAFVIGADFIGADPGRQPIPRLRPGAKTQPGQRPQRWRKRVCLSGKRPPNVSVWWSWTPTTKPSASKKSPPNQNSVWPSPACIFYDNQVVEIARSIKPSATARGELEITDVNGIYLERRELSVEVFGHGLAWPDTGTHEALLQASNFVETLENRQGLKIACPEKIAFRLGYIDAAKLAALAVLLDKCDYGQHLIDILRGATRTRD